MKTSTMLWVGAAAVAGYYLAKRAQSGTGAAAQAVTAASAVAPAAGPTVVAVDPSDDYGWVGPSWVPTWTTMTRGARAHRQGGGHGGHGGHHGGHH